MSFARTSGIRRAALVLAALAAPAAACERAVCRAQTRARPAAQGARAASSAAVAEGVAALDRGDAEAARASFRKALGLNPREAEAH